MFDEFWLPDCLLLVEASAEWRQQDRTASLKTPEQFVFLWTYKIFGVLSLPLGVPLRLQRCRSVRISWRVLSSITQSPPSVFITKTLWVRQVLDSSCRRTLNFKFCLVTSSLVIHLEKKSKLKVNFQLLFSICFYTQGWEKQLLVDLKFCKICKIGFNFYLKKMKFGSAVVGRYKHQWSKFFSCPHLFLNETWKHWRV